MKYRYLEFFNNKGYNLNLDYNESEDKWTGIIFIPDVSINLYESTNIYILEQVYNRISNRIEHSYPKSKLNNSKLHFNWIDDKNPEIFLYDFDVEEEKPLLEILDNITIDLDENTNDIILTDGMTESDDINSKPIQLNIAIKSDKEDVFQRLLIITDDENHIVAEINIWGETVGEDARFSVLLSNLGMSLFPEDQNIFKESDINEFELDYKLLNKKRKELLIEGHNIFPYKGSYKGLINIIKFFGYNNITIKEVWLNIDKESNNYGKYKYVEVIDVFDNNINLNDNNINLPNKIFKKTSLFQLSYKLNETTGKLDEYDLPVTIETSNYSTDEILIKLYGLKERLKKSYLPFNARIIDIIGEADYFSKVEQNVWNDQQRIEKVSAGIHPQFKISPNNYGYIQDLREIQELLFPSVTPYLLDPDMRILSEPNMTIEYVSNVMLGYFTKYSPNLNTIEELPDKPGIPVGYPCVLTNDSFDMFWNDAAVQWDELTSSGTVVIDFKPYNIYTNDIFVITETKSGEQISYTATNNNVFDTINGLLNAFNIAKNIDDGKPWSYFTGELVSNNSFRLRRINTNYRTFDFQINVIQSGLLISSFDKNYRTTSGIYTWDNFNNGNYYDIEWNIFKEKDDMPAWQYTIRGSIDDYNSITLALPYVGDYTVQMKLYDTFNQISEKYHKDYITVDSKNIEFSGFYKFRELEYYWDSNKIINWETYTSNWELPIIPESNTEDGHASLYESLNRANYISNNVVPDNSLSYNFDNLSGGLNMYTPGAYYWDNLNPGVWNDIYHLTWDDARVSGDIPANFRITDIQNNAKLEIWQENPNDNYGVHIFNTTDFQIAADELNNSTDEVISKFIYNIVYDYDTGGIFPPMNSIFIQAVAKYPGRNGDWTKLQNTNLEIKFDELHSTSNPTYNNIRFINDWQELPKLIFITFTYDKCTIPGKDKPKWHIINLDSPETDDIYFEQRWLTYLFKRSGRYRIDLELTDSNNNTKTLQKHQLVIK